MEISLVQVIGNEMGGLRTKVDVSRVWRKWDCPERCVFEIITAGIVVVRLVCEVNLTHVEIESKEREGASVTVIVLADVEPLHDAHVDGEKHPSFFTGYGVGTSASSKDARVSDQPIEIPYLRWLIGRACGKVMNELTPWRKDPARQRSWCSAPACQSPPR